MVISGIKTLRPMLVGLTTGTNLHAVIMLSLALSSASQAQTAASTIQPAQQPATQQPSTSAQVQPNATATSTDVIQPASPAAPGSTPQTQQPAPQSQPPAAAKAPVAANNTPPRVAPPPRELPPPIPQDWFSDWVKTSGKSFRAMNTSFAVSKNVNNIFDVVPVGKVPRLPATYLQTPADEEIALALGINRFSKGVPDAPAPSQANPSAQTGDSPPPPEAAAATPPPAATQQPLGAGSSCSKSIDTLMSCLNVGYLIDITSNEWILYMQQRNGETKQILKAPKDPTDDYFRWMKTGLGYDALALAQRGNYLLALIPPGATKPDLKGHVMDDTQRTLVINKYAIDLTKEPQIQMVRAKGRLAVFKLMPGAQGETPLVAPFSKILLENFDITPTTAPQ